MENQKVERVERAENIFIRQCQERERERRRKRRHRIILFRRTAAAVILVGIIVAVVLLFRGLIINISTAVSRDATAERSVVEQSVIEQSVVENSAVPETVDTIIIHTEVLHDIPETDLEAPFNQMSADWEDEDLNGWWRYSIPKDYQLTGGYLPDLVQVYLYRLCKDNDIRYPLALALIEVESGYQYDVLSATNDIGYMQVNYKWQKDKMEGMTEKALYNPYVNIRIGMEYLKELKEIFDTESGMLTGYKYGPGGAMSRCFNDRTVSSPYAEKIMERADEIEEELKSREQEVKGGLSDATCD